MIFIILDIFIIQLFDCLKDWVGLVGWSVGRLASIWFITTLGYGDGDGDSQLCTHQQPRFDYNDDEHVFTTWMDCWWCLHISFEPIMINIGVYTITTDKPTK